MTQWTRPAQGYESAEESRRVGYGNAVWDAAKQAIETWAMYPDAPWIKLHHEAPPEVGEDVMVQFRLVGLWWESPCRVVYRLDEPESFGFAYGTLPGHVEQGEELFVVERDAATDEITYRIRMVARAVHPIGRLLPWLVRAMQARFRKTSFETMQASVDRALGRETAATSKPERASRQPQHLSASPAQRT